MEGKRAFALTRRIDRIEQLGKWPAEQSFHLLPQHFGNGP